MAFENQGHRSRGLHCSFCGKHQDEVKKLIEPPPEQLEAQQQMQAAQFDTEMRDKEAGIKAKEAKAAKDAADAEAQQIENKVILSDIDSLFDKRDAERDEAVAGAALKEQQAIQTAVETQVLLNDPNPESVSVI